MKKFTKQNMENIHSIFEKKTGVKLAESKVNPVCRQKLSERARIGNGGRAKYGSYNFGRMLPAAGALLCFLALSAFAYNRFNDLDGDVAGFYPTYQGDGVFSIVVTNSSDKDLKLQEQVKLMRWSTGEEVEGNAEAVIFENMEIPAHSEETVIIDLSEGYDIAALEQALPAGDWYYLVLTNNYFAFGQDWMCSVDFTERGADDSLENAAGDRLMADNNSDASQAAGSSAGEIQEVYYEGILKYESWIWPTVSEKLSSLYGTRSNGISEIHSDHINIAGTLGDEVYAVADGKVSETGFEATYGNYILLEVGEGTTVKYGHLKNTSVKEGDTVEQGQTIGTLGQSGMATGPNLSLTVYENGEAVNPLSE